MEPVRFPVWRTAFPMCDIVQMALILSARVYLGSGAPKQFVQTASSSTCIVAEMDTAKDARLAILPAESERKEYDMNWDIVEGNWKQFKGKVKAQWGKLTEDQLEVIAGKRVGLEGKLQETYGMTKEEAEKQIKRFEEINKDFHPKSSS